MSYGINGLSNTVAGGIGISALPQISISGVGSSYGGLNELFAGNSRIYDGVRKYEIYESPEDVLALSVAWHRLRVHNPSVNSGISNLLDKTLFEHVDSTDKELANSIRDYYSKKIMMWKLKGNRFSNFRDDLNSFVHTDGTRVKQDILGMVYHLPNFYEHDVQLDSVRLKVNPTVPNSLRMVAHEPRKLQPISKIISKRKSGVTNHYWFVDIETGHGVQFVFEVTNPLEHIWSKFFAKKEPMEISGLFQKKSRDDFEYFSVKNWHLTNI